MVIDTHCHLGIDDYDNVDEIIKHFGNNIMIASGVNTKTNKEVLELINKYDNIYGTVGIHPEYASNYTDDDIEFIKKNIDNPKVVGIGEIGLDYHYDGINKEKQKELFIKQIEMAKKYHKTIVVHTRDASLDTFNIIKEEHINVPITIHCFSESFEMALEYVKLGCKLGVGGVVTFKNGKKLKEVVEKLDISNFVLETDSPYLAPEPYRGTKNEPKNVLLVAEEISKLKNMPLSSVIDITTKTSLKQYGIEVKNEL